MLKPCLIATLLDLQVIELTVEDLKFYCHFNIILQKDAIITQLIKAAVVEPKIK